MRANMRSHTLEPRNPMARYYFHLVNGHECILDSLGIDAPEPLPLAAILEIIGELQAETPDLFDPFSIRGWRLEVQDVTGHLVHTIQL
jgi:hypothetical protein